jgi:hypothetical protein
MSRKSSAEIPGSPSAELEPPGSSPVTSAAAAAASAAPPADSPTGSVGGFDGGSPDIGDDRDPEGGNGDVHCGGGAGDGEGGETSKGTDESERGRDAENVGELKAASAAAAAAATLGSSVGGLPMIRGSRDGVHFPPRNKRSRSSAIPGSFVSRHTVARAWVP